MNKIALIPTEYNVTRLFNIYLNALGDRFRGMPVSELEVVRKESAYLKLDLEFETRARK